MRRDAEGGDSADDGDEYDDDEFEADDETNNNDGGGGVKEAVGKSSRARGPKRMSPRGNPHLGQSWDSKHNADRRNRRMKRPKGPQSVRSEPHVERINRARKWMNLSARRFESIFGRIEDKQDMLGLRFKGLGL